MAVREGTENPGRTEDPERTEDPGRAEGKRRFGRLPEPIAPEDMVESMPEAPPLEQGFDPNADAVRRFGIPL
jgi:hypothetical protein